MAWQEEVGIKSITTIPGAEVVASAAETATFFTGTLTVPAGAAKLSIFLDVTVVTGTTPTLDIDIEWSPDGGTTWFEAETLDEFAQITAAIKVGKQFTVLAPNYRLEGTITGTTPSFTFAVDHVGLYA